MVNSWTHCWIMDARFRGVGSSTMALLYCLGSFLCCRSRFECSEKVYPSLLLGVACGYLTIFFGAIQLAPVLGAMGVPLFVGLFAALIVILGRYSIFALTPAAFFGFAVYFGTGTNLKATLIGFAWPSRGLYLCKSNNYFQSH